MALKQALSISSKTLQNACCLPALLFCYRSVQNHTRERDEQTEMRDENKPHTRGLGKTAEGVEVWTRMEVDSVTAGEGRCHVGLAWFCLLQPDCRTPVKLALFHCPNLDTSF